MISVVCSVSKHGDGGNDGQTDGCGTGDAAWAREQPFNPAHGLGTPRTAEERVAGKIADELLRQYAEHWKE